MVSYLMLELSEIEKRSFLLFEKLKNCNLCGWECNIDRYSKKSHCRSGIELKISSYGPHFGEERIISGKRGSGTIFFTNCSLKCVYCQNYDISQLGNGYVISEEDLSNIMLKLQNLGCHNINLVTPTHFLPQILKGIFLAIKKGLKIPFVYNCGGYENVETLKILDGIIDIYMPDAKYGDNEKGKKYSGIPDYWDKCKRALIEMKRQVGDIVLNEEKVAIKGLLIRHLILPNDISSTEKVLKFIKEELGENTWISLLSQYHPEYKAYMYPEIDRRITYEEYYKSVEIVEKIGLKNVIYQGFLI
ncbi:MAG: radical SAM protein [Candidatus Omnitrophica bacterium]|nr:radical SAM protein [Candidatus Omnitrophota bacterium]